ncbi:MAG TPA: type I methionyl aminopeptidase [Thermodesulfovibrionales bacterium]|nr:type I methionyl aminopeptidase [Thermodesulfovibrionales bacterium]
MIILKSQEEIEKMSRACRIVGETLAFLRDKIRPGVTTRQIDRFADEYIRTADAMPAFKGYRGYPATICASVNSEVIHGIPSDRILEEGDILGVDLGAYKDGFYGDAAFTFPLGKISSEAERLLKVTEEALYKGIRQAIEGNRVSDISHSIQRHAENNGYSVVRAFVGHGIGRDLHEDPQIPNFGPPNRGPRLKAGMTLAIEPMVNDGGHEVMILDDGWTAVTLDGGLSAHFEHTILITDDEPKILTEMK